MNSNEPSEAKWLNTIDSTDCLSVAFVDLKTLVNGAKFSTKCHPVLYIDIIKCLFIDDWVSFVNSLHIEMEALDCKAVVDT